MNQHSILSGHTLALQIQNDNSEFELLENGEKISCDESWAFNEYITGCALEYGSNSNEIKVTMPIKMNIKPMTEIKIRISNLLEKTPRFSGQVTMPVRIDS